MTWLVDHWQDVLGWAGSALLIVSLLQARVLRFRVLNLVAGLMLVLFNALIGVWPMVAMNLATSTINVWFIVHLVRDHAKSLLAHEGQHVAEVELTLRVVGPDAAEGLQQRRDGERVGERLVEVPAVDLGHVELAGDVGLGRAELARVPEEPTYGVDRVENDERAVAGAGLGTVPGAQAHRQLAADEGREGVGEPLGDAA